MSQVIDFTAAQLRRAYARQDQTGEVIHCQTGSAMHELAKLDPHAHFIDGDALADRMLALADDQQAFVIWLARMRALRLYGRCNEGLLCAMLEQFFHDVDAGIVSVPPASHGGVQ